MTRRTYRPLSLLVGSPTHEAITRREASRRTFKQITGAPAPPEVPPLSGYVYRTFVAAAVADYEGVATDSWTTRNCTTLSGSYSCLTYHQTTPNMRTTAVSAILPPVRYSIHEPSVAGATYDSCGTHNGGDGRGHAHYPAGSAGIQKLVDGVGMIDTILPVSGRGHVSVLSESLGCFTLLNLHIPSGPGNRNVFSVHDGQYMEFDSISPVVVPELQAIAAGTAWANYRYVKARYVRHRVNGVAVGSLKEWPFVGTPDPKLVTLAAGDTYEFDIWYEVYIIAALAAVNRAGKNAVWITLARVSDGSLFPPAGISTGANAGNRGPRFVPMNGFSFNDGFDPELYTYEFTLAGAHTWRLPNGTNTQKAATLPAYGWTATITRKSIRWTGPTTIMGTPANVTFHLAWDVESVNLRFTMAVPGEPLSSQEDFYYRPQASGDYIETTTSTEFGDVTWAPRGVFNGSGTTVFLQSAQPGLSDATVDPPPVTVSVQRPTSITLIRKTI